jgi:hypothetical protein
MSEIVPFHGLAAVTSGRLDIRAMMRHYAAPYALAEPFADLIKVLKLNYSPEICRCRNRRRPAAIAIHKAVAGRIDAVSHARDRLSVVKLAPDEEDVRALIGAMMMAFHAQPTQTSGFFIDTLVMELREPEVDQPFSLPAIAAAAREMWQTLSSPPSISQFLPSVRKHQTRLEAVFKQLSDVLEAAAWAEDHVKPEKPLVWDEDDPDHIPF